MKRPDLLVLIAIWEFLTAFVAIIGVSVIFIFAIFVPANMMWGDFPRTGALFVLGFGIFILLAFIGLAVAAGLGVLAGREWGRMLALVHAVISAFWVPIGTIIGVLAIVYLLRPEVKDYFLTKPS